MGASSPLTSGPGDLFFWEVGAEMGAGEGWMVAAEMSKTEEDPAISHRAITLIVPLHDSLVASKY